MLRSGDKTARRRAGSQRSLPLPSNACVSVSLNCEREKGRAEGMLGYAERNDQPPLNLVRFTACKHSGSADGQTHPITPSAIIPDCHVLKRVILWIAWMFL